LSLRDVLLERDNELITLEGRIAETCARRGGVVVVEGAAGVGKTRLLTSARELACNAQMQVVRARGNELEQDWPFGVVLQLFEPRWAAAGSDERGRLTAGPARWAAEVLTGNIPGGFERADERGHAIARGFFWLARNLITTSSKPRPGAPLLIAVDDVCSADADSLKFLAYLAGRIANLPILLIATVQWGKRGADPRALSSLRTAAGRSIVYVRALSEDAIAMLVREQFPDADSTFCEACASVTGGNAFLLVKLLEQLAADRVAADASTASRLSRLVPASILSVVASRFDRLPAASRALASAVAILGDPASLYSAAQLADLDVASASEAADELAALHLFNPGEPLSFVHPLSRASLCKAMAPLERGIAHRRAAAILSRERAAEEQAASHLLEAPPGADRWAIDVLRRTAHRALTAGGPEIAVRMLERALAERPPAEEFPTLVAELGEAESSAGLPHEVERLEHAIRVTKERPRRAQLVLLQAEALCEQKRYGEATDIIQTAAAELSGADDELHKNLDAAYISAATCLPALADEVSRRCEKLLSDLGGEPTVAQRLALAQIAFHQSIRGVTRADVRRVAELAWGNGALLDAGRLAWPSVVGALMVVDDLERALEICSSALAAPNRRQSAVDYSAACCCKAWSLYDQGFILQAIAQAHAGLDTVPDDWMPYGRTAYGALACCQLQRGQLEEAETALTSIDPPQNQHGRHVPFLLNARAGLRLAQLRPREALETALEAGRALLREFGVEHPGLVAWRSSAALAHRALGETARAWELAEEELGLARRSGTTRVVIRDLLVLGLLEHRQARLELLHEAARAGENYGCRLEYIHALVHLGAALRRDNRRAAAREPLREALELSQRGGATDIAERARDELAATGARPRRAVLSGVDALTASERRVSELAARGLTTRQIADSLFITPKAVEFHLRHIYQKLEISSRVQLKTAMGTRV
jgi:DNA-binding CsgD family transcriptional regulator